MNRGKKSTGIDRNLDALPTVTPEARENQLISLAIDLAETQLRQGTATSQVITHFLKLGSTKEDLEKKMLAQQCDLLKAKIADLEQGQRNEDLYKNAIDAMQRYRYRGDDEESPYGPDF